ncbi:hypothetical protein CEUSTIGMA_g7854.t1 [Chlamydomonas eustigma]|uniref:non-specific serine/threonine protein kinase n=1 Tax=Chlamydomonas eustigma TaxID=1157962 RepID=A0A250XBE8_9CHLO|nr:hypothetical protein CEUSTIGMA_g7854.t1 [Chlamydomonas eustigma]|eukprot:GAX80415.1 hypothetical protein CEUSTIGMA_g7854.t1 [Chlamydomonas eustigma]
MYAGMRAAGPGNNQPGMNQNFKVVKLLGKGSYGTVYQVQRLSDNQTYALKEMDVRAMNQAEREDATNEIRLLASVQHPNIISYNEAFLDGNRLCIIMEYAQDGDLAKVIKKYQLLKRSMPEDLIWKYFIQTARGVAALHSLKILHRDIKPGNIMIMANEVAKIGDLGIAKLLKQTMAAKTQIGTPHYMPPEIWKNRPYSFTSDSWAMGCILYEMATLKVPFEARSVNELKYKVLQGRYPAVPNTYSQDLIQMIRDCLDPNPDRRPSMDQILATRAVQSRMHLLPNESGAKAPPSTAGSVLLDTIKVPRNFQMIKSKLPPAQYKSEPGFGAIDEDEEVEGAGAASVYKKQGAEQYRLPAIANKAAGGQMPSPLNFRPQRQPAESAVPLPALYGKQGAVQHQAELAEREAAAAVAAKIAAAADNFGKAYGVYNKPPPPSVAVPPAAMQQQQQQQQQQQSPWYTRQEPVKKPVSESHAAYGAFYNSPVAAQAHAAMHAAMQRQAVPQQQQQQYKGYYIPSQQYDNPRGRNWPPGKLQPIQPQQQQQQQPQQMGRQVGGAAAAAQAAAAQAVAAAAAMKPPPWNYRAGGGGSKAPFRSPLPPGAHGHAGDQQQQQGLVGGQGVAVQRYPPLEWAPPRGR